MSVLCERLRVFKQTKTCKETKYLETQREHNELKEKHTLRRSVSEFIYKDKNLNV